MILRATCSYKNRQQEAIQRPLNNGRFSRHKTPPPGQVVFARDVSPSVVHSGKPVSQPCFSAHVRPQRPPKSSQREPVHDDTCRTYPFRFDLKTFNLRFRGRYRFTLFGATPYRALSSGVGRLSFRPLLGERLSGRESHQRGSQQGHLAECWN